MRAQTRGWSFMFLGYLLFATIGCESSAPAPAAASKGSHDHEHEHEHDHDHDHDHADGHAHGESAKGGDSHGADKKEGDVKKEVRAENFADALAQLAKLHATIRDGFAAKDIESAHGPLHDVGHLLEQIPALAGKESEDKELLKQVQEAVDSLFDNYGAVDEKLHGEKGASYEEVAEKIDKALEQLKKISLTKADS